MLVESMEHLAPSSDKKIIIIFLKRAFYFLQIADTGIVIFQDINKPMFVER
jgi:hypothetical protein